MEVYPFMLSFTTFYEREIGYLSKEISKNVCWIRYGLKKERNPANDLVRRSLFMNVSFRPLDKAALNLSSNRAPAHVFDLL